jgi:hypothetical protein
MNLRAIWEFVAGDSLRGPLALVLAIGAVVALQRSGFPTAAMLAFPLIIGAGLAASVFER